MFMMPSSPLHRGTTSSGAFFSASLDELGNNISPGAMLPSASITPSPSPMRILPRNNSPPSTAGSSGGLPKTSPRRFTASDARSGTVLIWGSGWEQQRARKDETTGNQARRMRAEVESGGSPETFALPNIDKEFEGEKILSVFGGYGHIFVINDVGELIYSGTEDFPQQKLSPDCGSLRQVACGQKHFMYLTENGALLSCGDNSFGQLGYTGSAAQGVDKLPRPISAFGRLSVAAVACGQYHTLCVTEQGDVYSWGKGMEGQLGHGRLETSPVPRFVKALAGRFVDAIAAGWTHSVAVTADGALYAWGDNTVGQLGVAKPAADGDASAAAGRRTTPTLVTLPSAPGDDPADVAVESAACGWGHTLCVSRAAQVWSFGFGAHGQLGHGDTSSSPLPRRVEAMRGLVVKSVHCGSHVSAARTSCGKVLMWGCGSLHRLGLGSDADHPLPAEPPIRSRLFGDEGACHVTQLAVCDDRVLAAAALRLLRLTPSAAPVGGGTRVWVEGDALVEARGRTKVLLDFSGPAPARRETRIVRGAVDAAAGRLVWEAPAVDRPAECVVEVSLDNGASYTSSRLPFRFYAPPVVTRLVPPLRPYTGAAQLLVRVADPAHGFQHASVRFTPASPAAGAAVVREARWVPAEGAFQCTSPPMAAAGPVSVELSFNGQQFHPAAAPLDYYDPPRLLRLLPDCCSMAAGGAVLLHVVQGKPGLQARLSGPPLSKDVVLPAAVVPPSPDAPAPPEADAGLFRVQLPAAQAVGWVNVEVSLDGVVWSSDGRVLTYYGALMPRLEMPLACKVGGLVNALQDSNLFPGACMRVRLGHMVVPAAYDASRGGAVFTVPAYEAASMGDDAEAVQVWFAADGREWLAVGMLELFDPFEVTDLKPAKSGKGGAPTSVTISGSGFVEKEMTKVLLSMEDEEDQLVDAEASPDAVTFTTPQLAPGAWTVKVSINGPLGEFVECPTAFTAV